MKKLSLSIKSITIYHAMKIFCAIVFAINVQVLVYALPSATEMKLKKLRPLFELGLGIVGTTFPYYPGSGETRHLILPFPAVTYRGDVLRAKRDEGLRGKIFDSKRFEFDISADGSLAAKSRRIKARSGMPSLDNVLELGPKVIYKIYRGGVGPHGGRFSLDAHFALRYGFTIDFERWRNLGLQFNPFVAAKWEDLLASEDLIMLTLGSKWTTRRLSSYYYEVEPRYETANRQAYHAHSGHMEVSSSASWFIPLKKHWWAFLGTIQSYYKWSSNRQSPLLEKDLTSTYVLGFYWTFYQTRILVLD